MFNFLTAVFVAVAASSPTPDVSPPSVAPGGVASTAEQRFPTPSPLPAGVALPGDETRDCGSLYAESKYRLAESNEINHEALNKTYVKGGTTRALETAGQLGGMIPVLGSIISMGSMMGQMASTKEDAERNYGELDRRSNWALDRMVYVSDMYRTRCIKRSK